ncbi:hypothetical protein O181_117368 [Austropuccinia psidii MF-1]|uniref:Uncharacterized protein n=1 Tax=Austropuccinia psidii MF-1 TaxID=1389203 RepID=A0A9Q3PXE7_9BASI|nr:hypothetical protein [Austropuccinia psidii MF-1]
MLTCPHPPPDETPTLPPYLCPHHSLCFHTPASTSPCLTILTLLRALKLMECLPDMAYHLHARIVPTQHASNTAYHPYDRSALPACLQCCLPFLRSQFPPDVPLTPPSNWPNPQGRL